jgi:hypothetical protein
MNIKTDIAIKVEVNAAKCLWPIVTFILYFWS